MKLKSDIQTWGEWLHMWWGTLKWFFRTFRSKSKFTSWEVDGTVKIKAKRKGMLVAGNTILEGGHLILE